MFSPPMLHTTPDLLISQRPSPSLIHIRSIPFTLPLGLTCWGQTHVLQPIHISASVHFRFPFEAASRLDALDSGTLSYSVLAQEITKVVQEWNGTEVGRRGGGVDDLVARLVGGLTGRKLDGERNGNAMGGEDEVVVDLSKVDRLELEICLPKASLLGDGVKSRTILLYTEGVLAGYSSRLELTKLRVSTLIGLREFERKSRQLLVVTVVVDGWVDNDDQYVALEMIVTKTIEESSLHTLEALSHHIAHRVLEFYIIPLYEASRSRESGNFPQIRLCLEKPNMVPCSEAPAVEILFECDPARNASARRVWEGDRAGRGNRPRVPLEGRLDEWIARMSDGSAQAD